LADEINRAPAKVQSALLEAMQEQQVTIGGESFQLPQPFMVMATQNPIEQEGTYRLPEAQLDRFLMKVVLDYPSRDEEIKILQSRAKSKFDLQLSQCLSQTEVLSARSVVDRVLLSDSIQEYIVDLVLSTRRPNAYGLQLDEMIAVGASPRATISLALASRAAALLQGRGFVAPEDVKLIAADVLRHRFTLTYEAEAEGVTETNVLDMILGGVRIG
ncbi:MAG: MoxR family ATPase, partial [Planctomycetota bacterium]